MLEHVLLKSIFLHVQGLNCGECVYELEEALNLNLLLKLGPIKEFLL